MAVPYTFAGATSAIPLSQLDTNFATTFTLGNTAIQLGNTVTTLNNMTLANVTISSGNVTITNVSVTTANVTTGNITTLTSTNATITNMSSGNVTITGGTINGTTLGATTASSANVTTLTTSSTVTLNGGTANGVAYLNGSKVLTTGSALSFDGTNFRAVANARIEGTGIGITGTGDGAEIYSNSGITYFEGLNRTSLTYIPIVLSGGTYIAQTLGGFEQMRLTSTGLGIGTSSPATLLHISGAAAQLRVQSTTSGAATLALRDSGTTNQVIVGSAGQDMYFQTGGSERARFTSGGNLLVGTTSDANGIRVSVSGADTSAGVALYKSGTLFGVVGAESAYAGSGTSNTLVLASFGAGNNVRVIAPNDVRFETSSAERARITSGGNLLVGTTTNNASGGVIQVSNGITFPATQSASSDANTLDDYEQGTWTPTIVGSTTAGAGTYVTATGRYTKVGNTVTATAYVEWTAHTGTGNMRLGGLPFATLSASTNYGGVSVGYVKDIALTANNVLTAYTLVNSTECDVYQYPVGGGASTAVPIDTAGAIIYTVTYLTAD